MLRCSGEVEGRGPEHETLQHSVVDEQFTATQAHRPERLHNDGLEQDRWLRIGNHRGRRQIRSGDSRMGMQRVSQGQREHREERPRFIGKLTGRIERLFHDERKHRLEHLILAAVVAIDRGVMQTSRLAEGAQGQCVEAVFVDELQCRAREQASGVGSVRHVRTVANAPDETAPCRTRRSVVTQRGPARTMTPSSVGRRPVPHRHGSLYCRRHAGPPITVSLESDAHCRIRLDRRADVRVLVDPELAGSMSARLDRRFAAALASLLVVASTLTACGSPTTAPNGDVGTLKIVDGQAHLTIPALWAAVQKDGTRAGGIEPAEIVVSTSGETSAYRVDLADIEAQGAGPAWRAATSMAAAFATIFVGADPASVDYHFTVTGPIDGPSAGGILTVGIVAAFRGQSIAAGHTMTGTITADGSIGVVSGVATKIEAAAREGYTTIVVPEAIAPGSWAQGNQYTELADSLGVRVVPVNTIGDAYAVMTGNALPTGDPIPVSSISWPSQVEQVTTSTTESLIETLDALTQAAGPELDADTRALAERTLEEARLDVASGALARAYGTTALALTRVARAQGAAATERLIATDGLQGARDDLRARAQSLLELSRTSLADGANVPVVGLEQQIALPTALAWASFSEVTMEGLLAELPQAQTPQVLLEMGRSVAEGELGVRVFLPDAIDVVQSIPSANSVDNPDVPALLSEYSAFILRACDAGEQYLSDVLGLDLTIDGTFINNGYLAGAVAARTLAARVTPQTDAYADEAAQLSTALTYFWLVSNAIASTQAYEVTPGSGADDVDAGRQDAMNAAIDDTWDFVLFRSQELNAAELDTSAATWSAAWALEQSLATRDSEIATESGWLAQGELWYDSVQVMMLISATSPSVIPTKEP